MYPESPEAKLSTASDEEPSNILGLFTRNVPGFPGITELGVRYARNIRAVKTVSVAQMTSRIMLIRNQSTGRCCAGLIPGRDPADLDLGSYPKVSSSISSGLSITSLDCPNATKSGDFKVRYEEEGIESSVLSSQTCDVFFLVT